MTTMQQLDEFSRFAKQLVEREGEQLPLDAVFDRWHQEAFRQDDLARIRASVKDYERGERGIALDKYLSEFDARSATEKNQ